MEYLAILIAVFLVSMSLKLKYKIQLFKSVKEALLLAILLLVIGGLWDSYAILRGYWSFEKEFFIGIDIGVMPLEECLFMLIIPFLVLVLYRIVTRKSYC
ncbi:MAG: lycopene cyclase domain-containing protein [Candidatus Bathyarchaeota archaeon]|nr:lycopene cyclase domain-containing protein [Candidatus Bathyarchaeota archaeon]MDH5624162.1 lycopene cyclase domain-containing protein [Candidatus Bathyarchaeota archaeon]MDH5636445.1 lycopene cyclase domain-containing protein [Candidatus Bathyarchaeota archaeon]MDH5701929.1 lycopene cyclase domain-containing protein [Candidatus Bathyarchaeota archaeon]